MGLITAGKLLLKNKKGAVGAVIDKVAPTVSKKLSDAASASKVVGWAKRMKQKLKD